MVRLRTRVRLDRPEWARKRQASGSAWAARPMSFQGARRIPSSTGHTRNPPAPCGLEGVVQPLYRF